MSEIRFNPITGEREIIDPRGGPRGGRRPNIGRPILKRPEILVPPTKLPSNILAGIGNIPGLNLDFSKLPKNIDFSNLDPRAINANPQGFQDMIERARAQEGLQGSLGGPMEFGEARKRAIMTGSPMPKMEDYDMSPLGPRIGNDKRVIPLPPPEAFQGRIEQANQQEDFPIFGGPAQGPAPDFSTLPKGTDPGGRFFTNPNGESMYQPPMPTLAPGAVGNMMMPPPINLSTGQPIDTSLRSLGPDQAPQMPSRPSIPGMGSPGGTPGFYDKIMPTAPAPAPVQTTAPAPAPYTGAGYDAFGEQPFVSSVNRVESGLDPLTKQLLFGLDGKGGFIPGAMRAAEKVFYDDEGNPVVIEEKVAGLSPDQLRAQELAREGVGIQDSYLQGAQDAYGRGVSALEAGLGRARGFAEQGLDATRTGLDSLESGLSQQEMISRGATGDFGTQLGGIAGRGIGATDQFGNRLGESENLLRGTTGAYNPSLTSQFYNPFEQQVVEQTISDILEQGDKAEVAARAQDIARGGESAFGSRARLGAAERREALGRGLGEAVSGIRAGGFGEAQRLGLGEFARQRQAERLASSGLAGLSGQRLGAQQALGSQLTGLAGAQLGAQQNLSNQLSGLASSELGSQQALGSQLTGLAGQQLAAQQGLASGLGSIGTQRMAGQQQLASSLGGLSNLEAQIGQQQQQAQFGLGQSMQNLGTQAQAARAGDVSQLYGIGQQQQALEQQRLDAERRNQLQAQQAPLAQYQSLMPFVGMAPAGQQQTATTFTPPPSPLQAGLGVGLSTFGALGNFMNQGQRAV